MVRVKKSSIETNKYDLRHNILGGNRGILVETEATLSGHN